MINTDSIQSIEDLLKADPEELQKLNRTELKKLIDRFAPIARSIRKEELQKIRETNLPTPGVYRSNRNKEDRLSWYRYSFGYKSGEKSIGVLRHKLKLLRQFFSDKTIYYEGWKNTLNTFVKNIEKRANIVVTPRRYKKFWDIYLKVTELQEVQAQLQSKEGASAEIQREIIDIIIADNKLNWNEDRVLNIMQKRIEETKKSYRAQLEKELKEIDEGLYDDEDDFTIYNPREPEDI